MNEDKSSYASRLFKKYPDKVPVIVKKDLRSQIHPIDKEKFLVPKELTVGQFLYTLRQRVKLSPEQALYLFFNGKIVNSADTMMQVYTEHYSKEDEMLHATYAGESTFG
jgi:GABA(A) receptor-associated protein